MLLKAYEANGLIILVAGNGSTFQRIGSQGTFYKDGVSHTFNWTGIWPKNSDSTYSGMAYYLLRSTDPLYTTQGAFTAHVRMNLPGCDNDTCNTNDWLLQEYEVE